MKLKDLKHMDLKSMSTKEKIAMGMSIGTNWCNDKIGDSISNTVTKVKKWFTKLWTRKEKKKTRL